MKVLLNLGNLKTEIGHENGSDDSSAKRSCNQQEELPPEDAEVENHNTTEGHQDIGGDEAAGNDVCK